MANSSQPNPRRSKSVVLAFLIIQLLYLFTSIRADPNPFPSHFSRFPRHGVVSSSSSSSKTKHKDSFKNPREAFDASVEISMNHAESVRVLAFNLSLSYHKSQTQTIDPINDCIELLDDTVGMLSNIMNIKRRGKKHNHDNNDDYDDDDDIQTWLSAALTNQETCMESLNENSKLIYQGNGMMGLLAKTLSGLITNSLDLFVSIKSEKSSNSTGLRGRKLLSENFPTWVSNQELKLLEASVEELRPHAVVAADGSGTHKSIGEALRLAVSLAGNGRTVIYVKAGTYHENIKIPTKQKNVMLVGDGKGKTVIVGDRSNRGGWTTFQSATVAATGDGFMARDITFVNSAGPAKNQAVALRVGSDRSVVYRCSAVGYQDTLYTHSKRQFYRDTDVYGTVDFIFGNSAAVFQNCNIFARKPMAGQSNFVTAQGRSSPNQNTGISIHNCKIAAASDLIGSKTTTYLGRPWKQYSRTVVMQSFLDGSIHPSGWAPWRGGFGLETLYYGEYDNSGPGSSVSGRVKWPGFHPFLTLTQAEEFTVARFISGNLWLPPTGVSFDSGLLK